MANKVFLDAEKVAQLKEYIDNNFYSKTEEIIKPGSGLVISDDGTISIASDYTNSIIFSANNAAAQASQAAITAGNYAAQAIQANNAIQNKIWYGTIEEYNALETINNSTIYIILHE